MTAPPPDPAAERRRTLLWLQSGGCGGCTMSLMCAESPDFLTAFDSAGLEVLWHPTLSLETGAAARAIIDRVLAGETPLDILCLEGAVMMGPNGTGRFHVMAGGDRPMKDVIAALCEVAGHVVGVGSCAAWGGIPAGGGNLVEAAGLSFDGDEVGGLLGGGFRGGEGLPVINIPGCPAHPDWVVETLMSLVSGDLRARDLDDFGRPLAISGALVHHGCSRNEYYEYKASASRPGDIGCMMEHMGCKGTQAVGDCNRRPWNGGGSCITGGAPCIACTEPGFEDPGHPFVETPKVAGIPVGLPADMPKAWFVALASLSKAATPQRLRDNATSDRERTPPRHWRRDSRRGNSR